LFYKDLTQPLRGWVRGKNRSTSPLDGKVSEACRWGHKLVSLLGPWYEKPSSEPIQYLFSNNLTRHGCEGGVGGGVFRSFSRGGGIFQAMKKSVQQSIFWLKLQICEARFVLQFQLFS